MATGEAGMEENIERANEQDPASPAPARGSDKALATRAALIELATRMFAEQGYVQTSMRDIAKGASLTTGALYGHFRNKADLLAEAIHARIVTEYDLESVPASKDRDLRPMLHSTVANYPERRELRALMVQGAAAAQTDEETRLRLRDEQIEYLSRWLQGYEHSREELRIDPSVDLESAVFFQWAAEIGLGLLEVLGIGPNPEGWADAYDRLMRGLSLPPE